MESNQVTKLVPACTVGGEGHRTIPLRDKLRRHGIDVRWHLRGTGRSDRVPDKAQLVIYLADLAPHQVDGTVIADAKSRGKTVVMGSRRYAVMLPALVSAGFPEREESAAATAATATTAGVQQAPRSTEAEMDNNSPKDGSVDLAPTTTPTVDAKTRREKMVGTDYLQKLREHMRNAVAKHTAAVPDGCVISSTWLLENSDYGGEMPYKMLNAALHEAGFRDVLRGKSVVGKARGNCLAGDAAGFAIAYDLARGAVETMHRNGRDVPIAVLTTREIGTGPAKAPRVRKTKTAAAAPPAPMPAVLPKPEPTAPIKPKTIVAKPEPAPEPEPKPKMAMKAVSTGDVYGDFYASLVMVQRAFQALPADAEIDGVSIDRHGVHLAICGNAAHGR